MKKPKPLGETSMFRFVSNRRKIRPIIVKEVKKRKQIIYGARAMNIQINPFGRRTTRDYDIYTRKPRQTARRIQAKLDREVAGGHDDFYSKPAKYKGTHKVMHEGADERQRTDDDFGIVDYTVMPKKVTTKRIGGVRYETLPSIKRGKKKTLKDPKSKYRHRKDREDLTAIGTSQMLTSFSITPFKRRKRRRKKNIKRRVKKRRRKRR